MSNAKSSNPTLLGPAVSVTALTAQEAIRLLQHPEQGNLGINDANFEGNLATSKTAAVAMCDQDEAMLFWQAQAIAKVQRSYLNAFELLKRYKFYEAWCALERCEIAMASLKRHFVWTHGDAHRLDYIETMVERWQELFPYKVFLSPEILKKRVECSICNAKVSLRHPCGHEKGQIYIGEECYHRITDCEFLSLSIVTNPVQKYSVAFLASEDGSGSRDHYDYGNVRFATDRLGSAFDGWLSEIETRTFPISAVSHISPNSTCPCGSRNAFCECCASKPELNIPHRQFTFDVPPPPDLPAHELGL